ncbi:MAG: hypothetical protein ACREDU_01805, partial [Methylocella sp.]
VEAFGDGEFHGVLQDDASVAGSALSGLSQEFEAGIGEPGVSATGLLECILNELGETLAFEDRFEFESYRQMRLLRAA